MLAKGILPGPDLQIAFDVGHSSIGWAVLQSPLNAQPSALHLLGCGVVTFGADDCLASKRRNYRRQRRHVRATRQRIRRLKALLAHLGALTPAQLDQPGCAWPWLLAARVLRGGPLMSWPELWDVLRWYAHNRGYDGNRRWSGQDPADAEDAEKVQNARALYQKHGTHSMAETFCAVSGLDPLGDKKSCNLRGEQRPKGLNAAFPREDVEAEVRRILERHRGALPGVDDAFVRALFEDWRTIPCTAFSLPDRFRGGLLFGQLVPRFDNRIIATCPVTFERIFQEELAKSGNAAKAAAAATKVAKVPSRDCPEFYRFRWAMQLANVQIATGRGRDTRPLSLDERRKVHERMLEQGYLTAGEFKKAVRSLTGNASDNLDQMLVHPDAQEALLFDLVKKLITSSGALIVAWPLLPARIQKRAAGQWRRGKTLRLGNLMTGADEPFRAPIDAALRRYVTAENTKKKQKDNRLDLDELLAEPLRIKRLDKRAPYTHEVMRAAWADVMERGIHPKEKGGCLYRDEAIRQAQLQRAIDEQTNNHLVRHRLRILERLHGDILKEYAGGDPARVARVTIEVNRELRQLSGKDSQTIKKELGQRLSNFKSVVQKLEAAFAGKDIKITLGLIRKARIAEDLGWTCPYTGKLYDAFDLLYRKVDKDHVIPRSERASDSLDSLVITFAEVNKMKGKRTARQFVEEFQGKTVEGAPQLGIRNLRDYEQWVDGLETFKGHDDDQRRKKRRKDLLKLRDYVEKEFTPRDLTQTSQLVRLGAQALQRAYLDTPQPPAVTSLPGSVTGAVRKGWNLLGCLAAANPGVLDEHGQVRTKTEIRDVTHLHHALDACVLGLAAHFIPNNGRLWQLLTRRESSLTEAEQRELAALGVFARDSEGRFRLRDLDNTLKEQIRHRLAERRVVQHIPADMTGLSADQTVWRVFNPQDQHPSAKRLARWFKGAGVDMPALGTDTVLITCRKRRSQPGGDSGRTLHETGTWRWVYQQIAKSKLIGLEPRPGSEGRLKKLKAVKILGDNYGLALDPEPQVIRFHKVWPQLNELRQKNGGKPVRVLRNGELIRVPRGSRAGIWRIMSTKSTEAYGLALDLALPDRLKLDRGNAPIEKLVEDGLEVADCTYTGVDSSGVEFAATRRRVKKSATATGASACPTTSSA